MLRTIAKTVAYTKAPKATFAVLHPKRAVRLKKLKYDMRHAYAPRITAVGAAALALPIGYLLGRRGRNHNREEQHAQGRGQR
ncbi:MAG: hypothetical protein ACOCVZ_06570 [Gemmatimonadota bacterium]